MYVALRLLIYIIKRVNTMKRTASGLPQDQEDRGKRSKGGLAFYARGLTLFRQLCSGSESWRVAKQLVGELLVDVTYVVDVVEGPAVWIQGKVTLNANAAAFPHQLLPSNTPEKAAAAAGQTVAVQLCLHGSTGELLDADSSCCPGAFHPVLGSFCPCAAGLLLYAAKQAREPGQGPPILLPGLASWSGSSMSDVLAAQAALHVPLCLVPQPTCYTDGLGLEAWQFEDRVSSNTKVHFASQRPPQQGFYGVSSARPPSDADKLLSIEDAPDDLPNHEWFGNAGLSSMATPAGFFDSPVSNGIRLMDEDMERELMMASGVYDIMAAAGVLPPSSRGRGGAAAAAAAAGAGSGAAGGGDGSANSGESNSAAARQRALLASAVGSWLTMYGGHAVNGFNNRPKVINTAFELLVGGSSAAPGRPLSCMVLLLRGLWEYLHCHGLGRLLSKPLKLLLALRNTLLVSAVPLWARRALVGQLDAWQHALLWQHAASPLEVSGNVGLVHLLRVGQEVHQLCLHHWDHPNLAALLTAAVADQQQQQQQGQQPAAPAASGRAGSGSSFGLAFNSSQQQRQEHAAGAGGSSGTVGHHSGGGSSSSGGTAEAPPSWQLELQSLLTLRLSMLDTVGQSDAYLELAMAGGAWREAIDRMLRSNERSQLLKAVSLLPRHIASLSERLGYMCKLLGLESLGAPERLEVAARLLLDMRDALTGEAVQIRIGRSSGSYYARPYPYSMDAGSSYTGHLWDATLFSWVDADKRSTAGGGAAARGGRDFAQQSRDVALWNKWGQFTAMFVKTAAQALFEVGQQSMKAYREHLRLNRTESQCNSDSGGQEEQEQPQQPEQQGQARLGASAGAGSSAAAAAAAVSAAGGGRMVVQGPGGLDFEIQLPPTAQGLVEAMVHMAHPAAAGGGLGSVMLVPGVAGAPVLRYCPDCQGTHPVDPGSLPPAAAPAPQSGDPSWRLLDIDQSLFRGDIGSSLGYPDEARLGSLNDRGKTGYIEHAAVLAAYRKVHPAVYPQLVPLCSLDALCLSTLSGAVMAHFDAGGVLDTSLPLTPLREMLGHSVVEMGPAAVRVQAALEVAVYTSVMSPPNNSVGIETRDTFYRNLTYQLLAAGQRTLALLAARARFKLCPSPRAAGELMEVAIASGKEAEAAAVDLILGKGLVRPPDAEDEALLRRSPGGGGGDGDGGGPARRGAPRGGLHAHLRAVARRMQREMVAEGLPAPGRFFMGAGSDSEDYMEDDPDYYDHPYLEELYEGLDLTVMEEIERMQQYRERARAAAAAGGEGAAAVERPEGHGSDSEDMSVDVMHSGSGSEDDGQLDASAGEQGQPIEILDDDDDSSKAQQAPPAAAAAAGGADDLAAIHRQSRNMAAHAAAMAANAADEPGGGLAAGAEVREAARRLALQRLREQQTAAATGQEDRAAAAAGAGAAVPAPAAAVSEQEDEDDASLDTRELLGAEAAEAIQLKDTAMSRVRPKPPTPVTGGRAAGAGGAGGNAAGGDAAAQREAERAAVLPRPYLVYDDDSDMDPEDEEMFMEEMGMYGYPGPQRPIRDLPPAELKVRPKPAAGGSNKRKAAAGGGGAGGGDGDGGGGNDGSAADGGGDGGRVRRRSSAAGGDHKRRRSASAELAGDPQQAALVCDLFGISSSSFSHPGRTLHVHLRRLSGLHLWSVVRYAAGRGARPDSIRRLGLSAWLTDGNSSNVSGTGSSSTASPADCLHWSPAAVSRQNWLETAQRSRDRGVGGVGGLPPLTCEPFEGRSVAGNCWSGFPSTNWSSFVAQERLPQTYGGTPHHCTPDANLAWLLAVLSSSGTPGAGGGDPKDGRSENSTRGSTPEGGPTSSRAAAAAAGESDFIPSSTFSGAKSGFVFTFGPRGQGYYRDKPPVPATVRALTAHKHQDYLQQLMRARFGSATPPRLPVQRPGGDQEQPAAAEAGSSAGQHTEVDLSGCAEVLQQLAVLSRGTRYGLPLLQLCHALLLAGCRSACLSLLPQALLPAACTIAQLQPNSCLVAALQELVPAVAKHGDVNLRVCASITLLLITRQQLPGALLEPAVLAGVLSWWHGLLASLDQQPAEWGYSRLEQIPSALAPMERSYISSSDGSSSTWSQLQRLLVRCILPCLGAQLTRCPAAAANRGIVPGSGVKDLHGVPLTPQQGFELLMGCDVVAKGHWALKLYFSRLCRSLHLTPDLRSLSGLLCPALSAAVQDHLGGMTEAERAPPADMEEWKANRHAQPLDLASAARARDWVACTITWLTAELSTSGAGGPAEPSAAASSSSSGQASLEGLTECLESLCAALNGWYGPELLPLALTLRDCQRQHQQHTPGRSSSSTARQQQLLQQGLSPSVLALLQSGLLPAVGRAEEIANSNCVKSGAYKSALRGLMKDDQLLPLLPKDVVRHLALTYWYQEATPAALLTANDMLLKLEGASSAQALQLPQGTSVTAAAATGVAAAPLHGGGAGLSGAAAICAALPQVHSVLLGQLDLVPSRGGLEAAGLRFLQLQVHAGAGQYESALESVFSAPPENGSVAPAGASSPQAGSAGGSLASQMEVADAVLRLVADNAGTPSISGLSASAPYRAVCALEAPGACCEGPGDSLLAALSSSMKVHALRLQMWRLSRLIVQRPPGIMQRTMCGPNFVQVRPFQAAYNAAHMPPAPTWLEPDILQQWAAKPLSSLLQFMADQGLAAPGMAVVSTAQGAAHLMCSAFQAQEQSLLWCVLRYAELVAGPQLEKDLGSLLGADARIQLGQLPVFAMGLGQVLKSNRSLMWAYCVFRTQQIPQKVSRYIHRNAHDQASLQRYLVKSTVSELQSMKAQCLPWHTWSMGQKAQQAAELAEWLWWVSITWPRTRAAAGAAPAGNPYLPPGYG